MSSESRTVTFDNFDEEVTVVFDSQSRMLTVLTAERMVGAMFLDPIERGPEREIVATQPIVDPDPELVDPEPKEN